MREIKGELRQQTTTHHPKENPCRNEDDVRHYPLQRYPLQPSAWVAGNKHPTKWQRRPECKPSSTILSSDPWSLSLLLGRFYHHHPPTVALSSQQRTQQMEGNKWRKCQSSQTVEREIVQRFNPSWGRLNTTRLGWFTRTHPSRLDEIRKWQIADDDPTSNDVPVSQKQGTQKCDVLKTVVNVSPFTNQLRIWQYLPSSFCTSVYIDVHYTRVAASRTMRCGSHSGATPTPPPLRVNWWACCLSVQ